MRSRCNNPNFGPGWVYYGGKGITVCKRWDSFENFLEDMGERPAGMTLDRKSNSRGYYKANCRWATWTQQRRNRTDVRMVRFKGRSQMLIEWAKELGVAHTLLVDRLLRGWTVKRAFTAPLVTGAVGLLTHDGLTLSVPEWAEKSNLVPATIYRRLSEGWSVADAVTKRSRHINSIKERGFRQALTLTAPTESTTSESQLLTLHNL